MALAQYADSPCEPQPAPCSSGTLWVRIPKAVAVWAEVPSMRPHHVASVGAELDLDLAPKGQLRAVQLA